MDGRELDLILSEEVANAGARKISQIKEELEGNKDAEISVLRELMAMNADERREQREIFRQSDRWKNITILVLIAGLIFSFWFGMRNQPEQPTAHQISTSVSDGERNEVMQEQDINRR